MHLIPEFREWKELVEKTLNEAYKGSFGERFESFPPQIEEVLILTAKKEMRVAGATFRNFFALVSAYYHVVLAMPMANGQQKINLDFMRAILDLCLKHILPVCCFE